MPSNPTQEWRDLSTDSKPVPECGCGNPVLSHTVLLHWWQDGGTPRLTRRETLATHNTKEESR